MIIGKTNRLKVERLTPPGAYLSDKSGNEVLLPNRYVPSNTKVGAFLQVFIYRDSEDRLIATTRVPLLEVDEFGYLRVKEVTRFGAFVDWGIEKDLLVPFREQIGKMEAGRSYLVHLYLDEKTDRLVATQKIKAVLEKEEISCEPGDEVELLIGESTDLGHKVIIDNRYEGLLFENEIFMDVMIGDRVKGYVKQVRPDKKIDVSLQQSGLANLEEGGSKIMAALDEAEGFLRLTDKSTPEEIQYQLQMSKKNFKRSLGMLYKKRLIKIEEEGIRKL